MVRFGNAPRVDPDLRQDFVNNWDLSVSKRAGITEQVYLQFTAEFFNAFNHPRFGLPNIFALSQPIEVHLRALGNQNH